MSCSSSTLHRQVISVKRSAPLAYTMYVAGPTDQRYGTDDDIAEASGHSVSVTALRNTTTQERPAVASATAASQARFEFCSSQAKDPSKHRVATECQDGVLHAPCSPELRPAVDVIEGVVIRPAEGRLSRDHGFVEADGVEVHIHIHALPDQVVHHLQKGIV